MRVSLLRPCVPLLLYFVVAGVASAASVSLSEPDLREAAQAVAEGVGSDGPSSPGRDVAAVGQGGAAPRVLAADRLVARVLERNQGVVALRAAADAAGAEVEAAGALDDPMLSHVIAPNTIGGRRPWVEQNVQVSQQLPWPGTLKLRSRAARAVAETSEQALADLRLRLAAQTRGLYAQWYYVHRALAINAENAKLLARLESVAETAYASGLAPQQDVLQAGVERTRLENQALELTGRQQTVRASINALLNRDPDAALAPPAELPVAVKLPEYAALREAALARYPQLLGLDAGLRARQAGLDLARKNALPSFKLMAGYNSLMDMPARRLTIGVGINIPFGGNHRGEIGAARARVHEAEARLADARSQLLGDLGESWAAANQAARTIELYESRLLDLSKLNLQAAEADYSGGNGDFLTLITAERQYLSFKLELARARADLFTQQASLDYQTGGVLAPTSSQETTP